MSLHHAGETTVSLSLSSLDIVFGDSGEVQMSDATTHGDSDAAAFAALVQREAAQYRASPPPAAAAVDLDDAVSYGAALKGRVVLVTGAGSGFGRAYSRKVGHLGYVRACGARGPSTGPPRAPRSARSSFCMPAMWGAHRALTWFLLSRLPRAEPPTSGCD